MGIDRDYVGIMEKKLDTTIQGLGFRILGVSIMIVITVVVKLIIIVVIITVFMVPIHVPSSVKITASLLLSLTIESLLSGLVAVTTLVIHGLYFISTTLCLYV